MNKASLVILFLSSLVIWNELRSLVPLPTPNPIISNYDWCINHGGDQATCCTNNHGVFNVSDESCTWS